MVTVCFDIGGTQIKSGLIVDDQLVSKRIDVVHDNSKMLPVLEQVRSIVNEYRSEDKPGELTGVGLALPSFVNHIDNKILSRYVKYSDASEIDLNSWVQSELGVKLSLHNDARAALLGEWSYGCGKGFQDLVMLTFGTGIGSAVVLNNTLLGGKDHFAGNLFGHAVLDYDGNKCNCGNIGCAESAASSWVLESKIRQMAKKVNPGPPVDIQDGINFKELIERAQSGDIFYQAVLNDCIEAWGSVMINVILAYNPQLLICGGGIMKSGDYLIPRLVKRIDRHGWIDSSVVEIRSAELGEYAAIWGLHADIKSRYTAEN